MLFDPFSLTGNRRHRPLGAWLRRSNGAETLRKSSHCCMAWLGARGSPIVFAPGERCHLLTKPPQRGAVPDDDSTFSTLTPWRLPDFPRKTWVS